MRRLIVALKRNACLAEKGILPKRAVLATLAWLALPMVASAATLPETGPENDGLRLRLGISSSTVPATQRMTLELFNVGRTPLEWSTASCPGDTKEKSWLFSLAYYETEPAVKDRGVQTMMRNDCVAVEKRLKPGASYREEYTTPDKGIFTDHNTLLFPSSGVYKVVATIYIPPGPRQNRVVSNPALFMVGHSSASPKQSSASILEIGEDRKTVRLALGPHHNIVPGDIFWLVGKAGLGWKFTVTKVDAESAWANAQAESSESGPTKRWPHLPFPGVGATVELRTLQPSAP